MTRPTQICTPLALLCAVLSLCVSPAESSAHLIREGHAQLTFRANGAYFMASYPVAAFKGFDDNRDGLLDASELKRHDAALRAQVLAAVSLSELKAGSKPTPTLLEGLLLNLSHSHVNDSSGQSAGADHLIVIGRFKTGLEGRKRFRSSLFAAGSPKPLKLRVSHKGKHLSWAITPESMSVELGAELEIESDAKPDTTPNQSAVTP